ncbi:testis-specific gene 10 protein isoform X1 [Silurus meridionalis]|uniref:testis-specific gene 10 protein isoform X1 n=1 Tax=Silurus meridionalis TaxID=175797 RepID=UPI001EECBEB6|nr:testis-specific gene 10 protein isoform X1 [Silurus meridionalis]
MAELTNKDKNKCVAVNIDQKITSQNQPASISSPKVKIESSQLDEDDQKNQLSSELDQKDDLQTLLKQLHTKVENLCLTESTQVADNTVTRGRDRYSLEEAERMKSTQKSRRSTSPLRQPPVKGGTYDSEMMRALRERDEMQSMLDKYERHLSEIQANVRVLTAERDKIKNHYQQAQLEIAGLRREVLKSKISQGNKYSATAQSILKRLESDREEATSDLHRMSTERDSLRERLKISKETAISERAHLEQRVEDMQNALLTLEQERAEQNSREAQMRETIMCLEDQVNTLGRKLTAADGELSCLKNECSTLRLSNTQTDGTLSETQRRLINRIGDLQRVQRKNKQLDEKNDALLNEVTVLKEELNMLKNTLSELSQHRDALQEQLERKNDMLSSTNRELDDKENSIDNMNIQIRDLEATLDDIIYSMNYDTRSANKTVSSRDRDLDIMRRKLVDSADDLNAVLKLKDATLRDKAKLRDELDRVCLDNKALQFKVEEAANEIEVLERKVQNYVSVISSMEDQLSSKERECKELQECRMELKDSSSEKRRLKERVESLESSLQEARSAEQRCSAELKQLKSTLLKQEEELRQVQSKHSHAHHDLEKTRDLCVRLDAGKEVVQQELESCRTEMELLRKQLAIEQEKELHRQLSSQERLVEIQLLRDKIAVADSKASTRSREIAQLRARSALLEADLEATRRQLNIERDERERAMKELHRLGLSSSFSSPILSSTLRTPPSPVRPHASYSPEHLPRTGSDHQPLRRSSDRSVTFRDMLD